MSRLLTERRVCCPFCAESITILIDESGGSQDYIEDCQVCCRPMKIRLTINDHEIECVYVDCAS